MAYKSVIIGCGNIGCDLDRFNPGFIFTHLSAYKNNPKVNILGICDKDLAKAQEISCQKKIPFFSDKISEIMEKVQPEIVSVCTPDETHYPIVKEIVKFGCVKGIWCEKPLATSLDEAEKILKLCKEKNIKILVNYFRRYDSFYINLKDNLEKFLGEIQNVTCYYTGGITTNGSHLLDILHYFFDNCESVSATQTEKSSKFSSLNCNLFFKKGLFVNMIPCDNKKYSIFEMNILGTKARLDIVGKPFGNYTYRYYILERDKISKTKFIGSKPKKILSKNLKRDFFEKALEDLISSINCDSTPKSSKNTIHSLELISSLAYSAKKGGETIKLPFIHKKFKIPPAEGDIKTWKSQQS